MTFVSMAQQLTSLLIILHPGQSKQISKQVFIK
jgi:hypothetical protein